MSATVRVEPQGTKLRQKLLAVLALCALFIFAAVTQYAAQPPDLIVLMFVGNLGIAGELLSQFFPGIPIIGAGAEARESPMASK